MPKPDYIICMPVSHPGYVVPGSLTAKCKQCPKLVWISPSSWLVRNDNPSAKITCMECGLSKIGREGGEMMDITPAQAEEIEEYRQGGKA